MQQNSSKCIKGVGSAPACPICKGYSIKYGFTKANKQRYQCKTCAKVYIKNYAYKAYLKYIDKAIVKLLQECCGIRSISRVLEIATTTVLNRIRTIASSKSLTELSYHQSYEVDELCTFIKSKNRKTWIVYAWCKESRTVATYAVGARSKFTLAKVINKLLAFQPKQIFTDKLALYRQLIPPSIHIAKKRGTNHIERMNLCLRTDLKRLSRKTICFSKSKNMLEACLKVYF